MKRFNLSIMVFLLMVLTTSPVMSTEAQQKNGPWEKYALRVGGFISNQDTSSRMGSGLGVDVDMEELLDMDSTSTVFKIGGLWRFSDSTKHRLDLSWLAFHRKGSVTVDQTFEIEDRNGDTITVNAGTKVDSFFNIDIYQLSYSYSFMQDDRVDLAALFGLYVMPMDIGVEVTGLIDKEGTLDFTAPLPTLGLRMDIALTPKWFFRSSNQIFYLEYQNFKGSLLAIHGAVEYTLWDHMGLGLGVDSFRLKAEAEGEDYPYMDFRGNVELNYIGLELYVRIFF